MRVALVYRLFVALGSLPFWFWYAIGAVLAFVLEHVLKYRKEVIYQNIQGSFPHWSDAQIRLTRSLFYRDFCRTLVESAKLTGISRKRFMQKIHCENPEVFDDLYARGKSVLFLEGHYSNWEWPGIHICCDYRYFNLVIYQPLKNTLFDKVLYELRYRLPTRKSGWLTSSKDAVRNMIKAPKPNLTVMLADQSPSRQNFVRVPFLNRDTAFWEGPARMAQKLDLALVFVRCKRIKKGEFSYSAQLLTDDPKAHTVADLTALYAQALEHVILENPSAYLWSHKRWKF